MSPMNYYTYLYRDPSRNFEPIYVGKGCKRRAWKHLGRTDDCHFVRRLRKMKREGVEPVIEFLCKDVDEELAFLCEIMAIEKFGRKDLGKGTLLNQTDGGDGTSGCPKSQETRDKIAEGNRNKTFSEETRAKMRASSAKRVYPKEAYAKMAATNTGRKFGPAPASRREKISQKAKARPKVICPHCNKEGDVAAMARWHFDNCKEKNNG